MYLSPWMMICRHIRPSWGNYWMNLIRDMILYMDIIEHKEHSKFRNFGSYVNYLTVRILLEAKGSEDVQFLGDPEVCA